MTRRPRDESTIVEALGRVNARPVAADGTSYNDAEVRLDRVRRPGSPPSLELTTYGPDGATQVRLTALQAATLGRLLSIATAVAVDQDDDQADDGPRIY